MWSRPSASRAYWTKSDEFARRNSPVWWSSHLRPDDPGTKWTRSPPMSACGLPSRSYSVNEEGALAIARSTTSRGNRTRSPDAVGGQPGRQEPALHLRAADLHARLGQHALGLVEDLADEVVREDVEGGSHRRERYRTRAARGAGRIAWDGAPKPGPRCAASIGRCSLVTSASS